MSNGRTIIVVGQVWRSKDPRDMGQQATVLSVDSSFVVVQRLRKSRIRRENFVRSYALVSWPSP